jgi:hypothetical protein
MVTLVETSTLLKKSGTVTLDADGYGILTFDPDNANQRWEVTEIIVSTNQNVGAAVVPVVMLGLNTTSLATMSPGNSQGQTWSGNQDTFTGVMNVGPCDFVAVIFAPPPGMSGTPMAGVLATAIMTGNKYTRRG